MKMYIVPIVTILAAVLLATCGVEAAAADLYSSPKEYEELSAKLNHWVRLYTFPTSEPEGCAAVITAYAGNKPDADELYLKKMCREVGFVRSVGKGPFDATVVTLVGSIEDVKRSGDVKGVECCFPKTDLEPVAKLKPSDRVIIRGMCFGKTGNNVLLLGCHVDTGTSGPQTSSAIDNLDEEIEGIGKRVRAFKFQSEPESCTVLIGSYLDNEASADKSFKGKMCLLDGFVRGTGKDMTGKTVVALTGSIKGVTLSGDMHGVDCYFPKSEAESMMRLKPFDRVIIRGFCQGIVGTRILLFGCHVDDLISDPKKPADNDQFDKNLEVICKAVRAHRFKDPEPEECALLIAAYERDGADADRRYKERACLETGYVRGTGRDATGTTLVTLVGSAGDVTRTGNVKIMDCYFPKSEAESVAKLKPSDRVIIRGVCTGKKIDRVSLLGCHVDTGTSGPQTSSAIDPFDEHIEGIGTSVRAHTFPTSEPEKCAALIAAYVNSEAEADKLYKRKMCRTDGFVRGTGKDVLGRTVVTLVGSIEDVARRGDVKGVDCYFPNSEAESRARLKPFDRAIIRGECEGQAGSRILLFGCHMDEVISDPKKSGLSDEFDKALEEITQKVRAHRFKDPKPEKCALLIAAYEYDEADTDRRYKDRACLETGYVRGTGKDAIGTILVTLVGRAGDVTRTGNVKMMDCYFPRSEAESVAKLKPSDRVIIRGICTGKKADRVSLQGCHVDEVNPGERRSAENAKLNADLEGIGRVVRTAKFPNIVTERCATMVAAYMNNEPQADKFYAQKVCRTMGFVRGTEEDAEGNLVVALVGYAGDVTRPGNVNGVNCYFPKSEAESMAKLKPSDHIIIRGMCLGLIINRISLAGCHVDVAPAEAPVDPDEKYDEHVEVIGKRVRAFEFPAPEADEVKTMIALFDSNEAQAEQRYKNKTCREIGYVRQKGKDVLGKIIVTVVGNVEDARRSGDVKGVDCYFPKSEVDSVLTLKPSDVVVIRGICGGRSSGRLFMLGCHIDDSSAMR